MKIDFSGTISIWMGVRDTDRGGSPIAKSVEFSRVSSREGHHLLGQSLRSAIHFLLLFLDMDLSGDWFRAIRPGDELPRPEATSYVEDAHGYDLAHGGAWGG